MIFCFCICLTACTSSEVRRTVQAEHDLASTEISNLRLTGTVQAARIQTTLDFVGTQAAAAATRSEFLQATLISAGTPVEQVEAFEQQFFANRPTLIPLQPTEDPGINANLAGALPASPLPLPNTSNATPTVPGVTPLAMLITPTQIPTSAVVNPDAPRLENPVMATGVRDDDCAANPTSTFTTTTPEIYLVVEAVNTPANAQFGSQWSRDGETLREIEFTLNFEIERACIWFFVDQTDFEFVPGTYTVSMTLNAAPAIAPITFTIQ